MIIHLTPIHIHVITYNILYMFPRHEVAVGTYPGGADIHGFQEVIGNSAVLNMLALIPGHEVYAAVRAINNAGLISGELVAWNTLYVCRSLHLVIAAIWLLP